jgi:NitT/TauT family transport system permease protein
LADAVAGTRTSPFAFALGPRVEWRPVRNVLLVLVALLVAWEAAKWLGGDPWRIEASMGGVAISYQHDPPLDFRVANDINLPHVWSVVAALWEPAQRGGPPLVSILLGASRITLLEAVTAFVIGSLAGLLLAIAFVHFRLLERSLVPYVIASQTVPIIAIVPPIVVGLGPPFRALGVGWLAVALVASYLAFFPVTIGALRGLRAADPRSFELMRAYAARTGQVLWKLRLPTSVPYVFTALKISATTSLVGAIIGELPSSIRDGLGGIILNLNQYYSLAPERLWAAVLFIAVIGMALFVMVALAERVALAGRYRPFE